MKPLDERESAAAIEAYDALDFDQDCWNCGGEGWVANCQDEIACLYPEDGCELCMRRCEYCNRPAPQPLTGDTDA